MKDLIPCARKTRRRTLFGVPSSILRQLSVQNVHIRFAKATDVGAITRILNQVIREQAYIGITDEVSEAERVAWLAEHPADRYPVLVAESEGEGIGWLSLSPYRKGRPALDRTAEVSYFIEAGWRGRGVGSLLLDRGIHHARETGRSVLIAILMHTNTGSIRLLEKHGFTRWAHLPGVGELQGHILDQYYYGLSL